jgi:hypothetical protein
MTNLAKRAAAFISDHDPFGDHFSAHDLAQLDPSGGYTVDEIAEMDAEVKRIREELLDYATHKADCRGGDGERCACGYLDLWNALSGR